MAIRPDNLVFVFGAGLGIGHKDFPKAVATHAHGMTPAIPKIEVADYAHPLRRRRKDGKRHAFNAVEHHGMRAEPLVEMYMRAFAKQIEIEVGQDRREAIRILKLDLAFAVARAQTVVAGAVTQTPHEEPGIVDAFEIAFVTVLVDDGDPLGVRKKDAQHGCAVFDVWPEVVEWIGMATLDHGVGFRREWAHWAASCGRERMRQVPASGTRSQSGRCASSYSIS